MLLPGTINKIHLIPNFHEVIVFDLSFECCEQQVQADSEKPVNVDFMLTL